MVWPVYHEEKIIIIGNRFGEIRKSVNKKSRMSLRDMLVLAHVYRQTQSRFVSGVRYDGAQVK